jgi:hypothetical protein
MVVAHTLFLRWMSRSHDHAKEARMPGASEESRHVKILNANWSPSEAGGDGQFEVLVVTDDDQRYTMPASPSSMTALVALAKADTVMVWDPVNRSLIVANIVGTMPWTVNGSI